MDRKSVEASLIQNIVKALTDARHLSATDLDMSWHFYFGGGREITMDEIGLLTPVKIHYYEKYLSRFIDQIDQTAQLIEPGSFQDSFENNYDFASVFYSLGHSETHGQFNGFLENLNGTMAVRGAGYFAVKDEFDDPLSIHEVVNYLAGRFFPRNDSRFIHKVVEAVRLSRNFGGSPFKLTAKWQEEISFELSQQKHGNHYFGLEKAIDLKFNALANRLNRYSRWPAHNRTF